MMKDRRDRPNTKFERLPFAGTFSMKNIPIPKNSEYMKKLIAQTEKIVRRMRWRALFFLKEEDKYKTLVDDIEFHGKEETYGFNSTRKPPPIKEIEPFEKDLYDIVKNIVFCEDNKHGKFQKNLSKHSADMNKTNSVIIAGDKSNNYYMCDVKTFGNLRDNNIKKEHRKSTFEEVNEVNAESRKYAVKLELEDCMQKYTDAECFITLKDHKENFIARPQCRLINPAKNDLGRVVKVKVERINNEIRHATGVNQWRSTQDALSWFNNITDPNNYMFLKFDIVQFYPSISSKLLRNAINFAKTVEGIFIPKEDEEMIMQCRKSFLFCDGEPWTKVGAENFDVPMGSYDGAEICELVGLYLLHRMTNGKSAIF